MAQPTPNSNALAFAQSIYSFTQAFAQLLESAQRIAGEQATHGYAANLSAMPTYTPDATGAPPTVNGVITPDSEPTAGNPIIALTAFVGSFYNLDTARSSLVNDFVTFATGSGAAAQATRTNQVNALLP